MTQLLLDDILQQIKQEIEIDAQGGGKATIRATAKISYYLKIILIKRE